MVFGKEAPVEQTYRIFTDGSAIGNPGPGGWGVVVIHGKKRWEMSGANPWTTISEMELVATVQALRSVEGRARIELDSDSEYLIYGMRAFVSRWQRQGWRNRRRTQLQHRELWTELIEPNTSHPIRWKWIRSHNGHCDQTRADELTYEAARSLFVQKKVAV
jgi:ribonuclease HI